VSRIFTTLASLATLILVAALILGFLIGDPRDVSEATRKAMSLHVLTSVAALIFGVLVHAVLLTYFMGTSRWMEEVRLAYQLDTRYSLENRRLKYRTIPPMVLAVIVLIFTIPSGALSVDAGNWTLFGVLTMSPAAAHRTYSLFAIVFNAAVNVIEYRAVRRNGELVASVLEDVRRIRVAQGRPV
jgi:hypothetical protein